MAAQHRLLSALQANEAEIVTRYTREKSPAPDEYWVHDAKFNYELLDFQNRGTSRGVVITAGRLDIAPGMRFIRS